MQHFYEIRLGWRSLAEAALSVHIRDDSPTEFYVTTFWRPLLQFDMSTDMNTTPCILPFACIPFTGAFFRMRSLLMLIVLF